MAGDPIHDVNRGDPQKVTVFGRTFVLNKV